MSRIALILNPRANRGRAARLADSLRQAIEGAIEVELLLTTRQGEAADLVADAARRTVGAVVAVGGDGTVHEVVNGLMALAPERRPAMGLFPVGSGNDFAYALGSTGNLPELTEMIRRHQTRAVDVGRIQSDTGRSCFCANNMGILLEGEINLASHHLTWPKGSGLYLRAALQTLVRRPPVARLELVQDGITKTQEAVTLSVGNGPRSGGKFLLTPDAVIDDGRFDYAISKPASRLRLLALALKSVRGRHWSDPRIVLGRFSKLTIRSDIRLAAHVDGEPWARPGEGIRELAIEVLPGALRFLC